MRSMDNSKNKFEMKRSMEVAQLNGGRKQRKRYYSPSENGEVGYDFNHINLSSLDANCEQTIENLSKVWTREMFFEVWWPTFISGLSQDSKSKLKKIGVQNRILNKVQLLRFKRLKTSDSNWAQTNEILTKRRILIQVKLENFCISTKVMFYSNFGRNFSLKFGLNLTFHGEEHFLRHVDSRLDSLPKIN